MRKRQGSTTGFIDVLANTALGFFTLLLLMVVLANPPKKDDQKKSDIVIDASLMVTMEWPDNSTADVDLFSIIPNEKVVFFGRKESGGSALDRDDQGRKTDTILMPDGSRHVIRSNWEHLFVKKMIPGRYAINVVLYHTGGGDTKTPVKVRIETFKPYKLVMEKRVILSGHLQEETIISFDVDDEGKIIQSSMSDRPVDILKRTSTYGNSYQED